jgi:outer membrane protein W
MKRLVLFLCAGILSIPGFAQTEGQLLAGPRLGVNIASASNVTDSKSLVGLAFGVTGTYGFSDNSAATVDLLYSGEGFAQKSGDGKAKLGYLLIPIYYNYFFGEPGSELRPKVYAGIAPAFLMSGKDEDGDDIKDQFGGLNFSLSLGGGVNYALADNMILSGDLRAYFGVSDLRDKDLQDDINVASTNIQLSVALLFDLFQ